MATTAEFIGQGVFSRKYQLLVNGQPTADDIRFAVFRCKGAFHYNGVDYTLGKRNKLYTLEGNGQIIAQARKTFWTDRFSFELMTRHFMVKKRRLFSSHIYLLEEDTVVAEIYKQGFTRSRGFVEMDEDWPVPLLVYIFWMCCIIWRNEEAAAAG